MDLRVADFGPDNTRNALEGEFNAPEAPDSELGELKIRMVRSIKICNSCGFCSAIAHHCVSSKFTGIRQSGTGRWMSHIQGPFTKKNKVHLGTFSTAEEAAEPFNRARHEFDAVASIVNKCNEHEGRSEDLKAKKPVLLHI